MPEDLTVEARGETVGEAKWAALRELERRVPALDREAVTFQVLSEGERGLMGVGREPAHVVATLPAAATPATAGPPGPDPRPVRPPQRPPRGRSRRDDASGGGAPRPAPQGPQAEGADADQVREILAAVCAGIGVEAEVHVARVGEGLTATLTGGELGLLIGRRGHTMDALQYLVNGMVHHATGERVPITIDAQDYRRRRDASLRDAADRAAADAARTQAAVNLEPMSSVERKVVHLHLQGREDVVTESDGREPYRYVVVRPA